MFRITGVPGFVGVWGRKHAEGSSRGDIRSARWPVALKSVTKPANVGALCGGARLLKAAKKIVKLCAPAQKRQRELPLWPQAKVLLNLFFRPKMGILARCLSRCRHNNFEERFLTKSGLDFARGMALRTLSQL